MRVVMVAHSFPRWRGDVAGSFLLRLADALIARGHVVAVVAPSDGGRGGRLALGAVEVLQVRYAAPARENLAYTGDMARAAATPSGAWAFVRLVRALRAGARETARRMDAQIVHAFWWVPGAWAAVGLPLPAVVSLMGTDVAMMRSPPARLLARRVLRRAARVTALSTFLAGEARRLTGLGALPIERVPVPADTGRFEGPGAAPAAARAGVVYLGRLTAQKRVDLLLDAVHAARLDAPVTIVGDGPARADLERRADALGLSNVRFLGAVPDEEVPGLIRSARVAAFPSRNEGLGLAAAEALMLGTPVVAATDGGGVLDLVRDGEGGVIAAPTPEAVGAALARCLADPAMTSAAAAAGARLRAELSPDGVARRFEEVYDGLP
jgi:glycosyltransferase involved in cell wall biosynthesis